MRKQGVNKDKQQIMSNKIINRERHVMNTN